MNNINIRKINMSKRNTTNDEDFFKFIILICMLAYGIHWFIINSIILEDNEKVPICDFKIFVFRIYIKTLIVIIWLIMMFVEPELFFI